MEPKDIGVIKTGLTLSLTSKKASSDIDVNLERSEPPGRGNFRDRVMI